MTTNQLEDCYPEAWEALPSAYRADSCLEFYWADELLHARPTTDQVAILGKWVCVFDPHHKTWR